MCKRKVKRHGLGSEQKKMGQNIELPAEKALFDHGLLAVFERLVKGSRGGAVFFIICQR